MGATKIFNRAVQYGYNLEVINGGIVQAIQYNSDGKILVAEGLVAASTLDGSNRFAKGGDYIKTDAVSGTDGKYTNVGTSDSASFALTDGVTSADLTGGTGSANFIATNNTTNGVQIANFHNSNNPQVGDIIFSEVFTANDDGGNQELYAEMQVLLVNPTDGSEQGGLGFRLANGAGSGQLAALFTADAGAQAGVLLLGDGFLGGGNPNGIITTEADGDILLTPNGLGANINGGRWRDASNDITGPGAIPTDRALVEILTTGTGDAMTLADGVPGQRIVLIYTGEAAGADTAVVTPATFANGTTMTFNTLGDRADLVWSDAIGWIANVEGTVIA